MGARPSLSARPSALTQGRSPKIDSAMSPAKAAKMSTIANSKTHIQPERLRFIKQIRAHQLLSKARRNRPKMVQDFVREERLPRRDPRNTFFGLFPYPDIFKVVRPLKPQRIDAALNSSNNQALISSGDSGCRINIKVLRGFNIPIRSGLLARSGKANDSGNSYGTPVFTYNLINYPF